MRGVAAALVSTFLCFSLNIAYAQTTRCDIPREARDIWHCENGFVIGPENVIIRLPIPETDPEALYNAGLEAAQREDWRVAIAYFTAAHQRAHLVPKYMYNLGLAHARAGNEIPAIAWLAAYQTAAPDAQNRTAVWAQIATLEAEARRSLELVRRQAREAAQAFPREMPPAPPPPAIPPDFFIRRQAEQYLSLNARPFARSWARRWPPTFVVDRAMPGGTSSLPPAASDPDALIFAARTGNRQLLSDAARAFPYQDWRIARLATGSTSADQILAALQVPIPSPDRLGGDPGSERDLAQLTELLLLMGDRTNATRALDLTRAAIGESYTSGWAHARVRALVSAEEGGVDEAALSLSVYYSRRLVDPWRDDHIFDYAGGNWSDAFEPSLQWAHNRFDSIGVIAEYLVWRGRTQEALQLAESLDSLRALDFARWLRERMNADVTQVDEAALAALEAAALTRANGGVATPLAAGVQNETERQTWLALTLVGAAANPDWWISQTDRPPRSLQSGETFRQNAVAEYRFKLMALASHDIENMLASIRSEYGEGWGQ